MFYENEKNRPSGWEIAETSAAMNAAEARRIARDKAWQAEMDTVNTTPEQGETEGPDEQ